MIFQYQNTAQEGDLVELTAMRRGFYILRLQKDGILQTHRGVIKHADLIGKEWGSEIFSHLEKPFYLYPVTLSSMLLNTKRNTQILYPKDIGYILITLGIGPGSRVIEAGTGSGGLTQALAFYVGDSGHVYSYENRPEMQNLAKKNVALLQLQERVDFKLHDIITGFDETDVDALFLDVPNPHDYVNQVKNALRPGGSFGSILPTVNQVSLLLNALRRNNFSFVDVCEILLRFYKPEEDRLRPTDRMVAHTGYLIFARSIQKAPKEKTGGGRLNDET
ncbi:MAG: tRNA (adenine-N1)-methyltransferase [Chloroflexi bacterium]|nr:tRNA (adenine-N1)-methyltransferase [Chloroflexota bacterium]